LSKTEAAIIGRLVVGGFERHIAEQILARAKLEVQKRYKAPLSRQKLLSIVSAEITSGKIKVSREHPPPRHSREDLVHTIKRNRRK